MAGKDWRAIVRDALGKNECKFNKRSFNNDTKQLCGVQYEVADRVELESSPLCPPACQVFSEGEMEERIAYYRARAEQNLPLFTSGPPGRPRSYGPECSGCREPMPHLSGVVVLLDGLESTFCRDCARILQLES